MHLFCLIPVSSSPQLDTHIPPRPKYFSEFEGFQVHVPLLESDTLSESQVRHSYSDGPEQVLHV